MFQLTAARRRLVDLKDDLPGLQGVSTHSRPKAAGGLPISLSIMFEVSTHSRPKAAGAYQSGEVPGESVSTHSRPKAAGMAKYEQRFFVQVSTHSRPKAAGISREMTTRYTEEFQLTAARRRLGDCLNCANWRISVSTHSRPKAAGFVTTKDYVMVIVSTHSRPKAAGAMILDNEDNLFSFNSQPPEGGWEAL